MEPPVAKPTYTAKSPWGIAFNRHGEMIVTEGKCIAILSATGNRIRTIDTRTTEFGEEAILRGVTVDSEDNIIVVDGGNHCLLKFSREGVYQAASKQQSRFIDVCASHTNGKIYATDKGRKIHIFNSDLTHAKDFGVLRGDPERDSHSSDRSIKPHGIAVDRVHGDVFVTDKESHRVQQFTPDGDHLCQFGKKGTEEGELLHPNSIYINDNTVYVGQRGDHPHVSVFDCSGNFIKRIEICQAHAIAVDQNKRMYATSMENDGRIIEYNA